MPWARIDDRANSDAKLLALSDSAYRLWVAGLIFCQFNLTDGFIPTEAIQTFGVRAKNKRALVEELTSTVLGKRPLWVKVEGGWRFNDFLDWNDSSEDIKKQRARGKDRVDRFRAKLNGHKRAVTGGVTSGATNAVCNALQTANNTRSERSLFAASTTTTTEDQNQEPRADAPRSPKQLRMDLRQMVEVRRHLRAACHRLIETVADCRPGATHQQSSLKERLKVIASRDLQVGDYDSAAIERLIETVERQRAKREAA